MRNNTEVFFAVQETREDGWDYGSESFKEAAGMLKTQGHGLIAVIDCSEDSTFCISELKYGEAFD